MLKSDTEKNTDENLSYQLIYWIEVDLEKEIIRRHSVCSKIIL